MTTRVVELTGARRRRVWAPVSDISRALSLDWLCSSVCLMVPRSRSITISSSIARCLHADQSTQSVGGQDHTRRYYRIGAEAIGSYSRRRREELTECINNGPGTA